jgi:hypothetical protein
MGTVAENVADSLAVVMERQSDDDISDRLCMLGSCTYYR